eukprot:CAMPEP_0194292908 /NCGR_PEP_ID=MMETSP0169-20130528/46734_1 /TAXON_ID=218684 /ORGANISM="Corethron pennatum, Strain L29A3" /LENGTH=112 /DNA_ID=CAMNT_0039041243 /DNA_START=525 /DNA_END=863 /DNA_ORIENTATION=+
MAPNFTGDSSTDALRTISLCEEALEFAIGRGNYRSGGNGEFDDNAGVPILGRGGTFLCKYFTCGRENEEELMVTSKEWFGKVHVVKPKSSRKESAERYLLALDFIGGQARGR